MYILNIHIRMQMIRWRQYLLEHCAFPLFCFLHWRFAMSSLAGCRLLGTKKELITVKSAAPRLQHCEFGGARGQLNQQQK